MIARTDQNEPDDDRNLGVGSFTRPELTDVASVLVLLIFVVVLLWPLICGRSLYWGDIMLYFEPMQRFASAELRAGRLPLWNPYLLCGQPFLGNPQMGVFYPLTLLTPFVSASRFLAISTILHTFLCGFFMYLYLRRWVRCKLSALIGSIAYMGSTCLVARIQFPPMIVSACYCPLILAVIDMCLERSTTYRWLGLVVSIGLLALSAHPQMAYFTVLICTIYAGCRVWSLTPRSPAAGTSQLSPAVKSSAARSSRTLWLFAGAAIVGFALAAGQLVPMLELMRVSTRERMTPTLANRFVFDLSHLATLLFPNAFGTPAHADYFGGGNAWEPGIFIGWLPLALIVYAAASCRKARRIQFWILAAVLSLWLSTGTAGGLFWLAFYIVPGLSNFHDPARFLFITTVSLCVLTCIGLDIWQRRRGALRGWCAVAAVAVTALPLIWFGTEWNPTTTMTLDQRPSHRHTAISGRSYLPAHDIYWRRFVTEGYSDYGPASNLSVILNSDTPNVQMREGIETAAGYEPVPVSGPAEVDALTRIAFRRDEPSLISLLQIMDVTDVLLPDYRVLYNADFTDIGSPKRLHSDVSVERVNRSLQRAWLTPSALHIEGKMRAEASIAGPDFDPAATAIVSGLGASQHLILPEHPPVHSRKINEVRIDARTTTSIQMSVDAGKAPAYLVYSGTCYPGWKAEIDGKPADVYCTDVAFLGLEIPPGKHRVVIFYAPSALRLGMFVLAAALMFLTALATFSLVSGIGSRQYGRSEGAHHVDQRDSFGRPDRALAS